MNRREFARSVLTTATGSSIASVARPLDSPTEGSATTQNLSVMLWTILPNEPFEHRVTVVAEAGYRSIEFYDDYEHWTTADFDRLGKFRNSLGVAVDAICVNNTGVSNPDTADEFLRELSERLAIAETFECRDIIAQSGVRVPKYSRFRQRQASIDTLRRAGDLAAKRGCRILLESLDPEEEPHWFLNSVTEGFDIVRAAGHPHVRMLYDFYHEQISGGNLIKKLADNIDLVGLVHVADVPGRHEPGTGEINYRSILRKLAEARFTGSIAMEFKPTDTPVRSLRAAREYAEAALSGKMPCVDG